MRGDRLSEEDIKIDNVIEMENMDKKEARQYSKLKQSFQTKKSPRREPPMIYEFGVSFRIPSEIITETITESVILNRNLTFINVNNHPIAQFSEFSEFTQDESQFKNIKENDVLISINNERCFSFYEALGKLYHGPYPLTLQFRRDVDYLTSQRDEEKLYEENMKCIFRKMDRDFSNTISVQELRFLCKDNADFMFHRFDDDEHHELGMKELKRIINTNELAIEALAKLNNTDYQHEWKSVAKQMRRRQIAHSKKQKACLTYQTFLFILFIIISILAVLERFFINYMPDGQLPDINWYDSKFDLSFQLFHVVQRITARIILICLSFFFFTMTRVTHNFACEMIPFTWFDMRNYNRDTFMFHKKIGLYIVIITIFAHVGFAFVPLFDRPFKLTDEALYPFYIPFRRETPFPKGGNWNMRKDDIYQGAIGILLAVFMPLTIICKPWRAKYNISYFFHIAGAFVMIWLVYRIPEHVRTFVFLTIPIGHWLIDRIVFMFLYRRRHANVRTMRLDDDYVVACFPASKVSREIGDQYFYSCSEVFGFFNFAHPFTTFILDLPVEDEHFETSYNLSDMISGEASELHISNLDYPKGAGRPPGYLESPSVVDPTVERSKRQKKSLSDTTFERSKTQRKYLAIRKNVEHMEKEKFVCSMVRIWGPKSFSSWLTTKPEESIQIRGPFRRVYSRLMQQKSICHPLVLMASGAGVGYLLDFVRWIQEKDIELLDRVHILYSCHSLAALTWVTHQLGASDKEFLEIDLHLTSTDFKRVDKQADLNHHTDIEVLLGRFDLEGILDGSSNLTEVYFCGVKSIHDIVQQICNKRQLEFFSEVPYD